MTDSQFERLRPHEDILLKAEAGKFYRYASDRVKRELGEVYDEITGKQHNFRACSSCSGRQWMQRLGSWYKCYKSKTE